jgi:hypothetical protein
MYDESCGQRERSGAAFWDLDSHTPTLAVLWGLVGFVSLEIPLESNLCL